MLERGGGPVWPGLYGAPGAQASLHHAAQAQLQLLSQQQLLRQHELLMIQQHTAQVLELQRSAQLVVRPGGQGAPHRVRGRGSPYGVGGRLTGSGVAFVWRNPSFDR